MNQHFLHQYFLKPNFFSTPQQYEVNAMDALFAEMVLDTAICNFRKEQIKKEIDQSLRDRNKAAFLRLTEELKSIS